MLLLLLLSVVFVLSLAAVQRKVRIMMTRSQLNATDRLDKRTAATSRGSIACWHKKKSATIKLQSYAWTDVFEMIWCCLHCSCFDSTSAAAQSFKICNYSDSIAQRTELPQRAADWLDGSDRDRRSSNTQDEPEAKRVRVWLRAFIPRQSVFI